MKNQNDLINAAANWWYNLAMKLNKYKNEECEELKQYLLRELLDQIADNEKIMFGIKKNPSGFWADWLKHESNIALLVFPKNTQMSILKQEGRVIIREGLYGQDEIIYPKKPE